MNTPPTLPQEVLKIITEAPADDPATEMEIAARTDKPLSELREVLHSLMQEGEIESYQMGWRVRVRSVQTTVTYNKPPEDLTGKEFSPSELLINQEDMQEFWTKSDQQLQPGRQYKITLEPID